jgi:hypothetical protein
MEDSLAAESTAPVESPRRSKAGWQILWFSLHLGVVYAVAKFCTPWLSGWTLERLLPLLEIRASPNRIEFLFSHLFAFSFVPAFVAGLVNARFRQRVAAYVWLLPASVLAYKLATFHSVGSVLLHSQTFPALRYYFGSELLIPEYHNWQEFWSMAAGSQDMFRGADQLSFTAPFYAGFGYSLAAWFCLRTGIDRKIVEMIKQWEVSRFPDRQ